jgi:hypothetical protein
MRNGVLSLGLRFLFFLLLAFVFGLSLCGVTHAVNEGGGTADTEMVHVSEPFDFSKHFSYKPLDISPGGEQYALPLAQDDVLGFADMCDHLVLEAEARGLLLNQGFVTTGFGLVPRCEDVGTAYDVLGRSQIPVLVTSGSLLHTYHVLFDDLLSTIEAGYLYDDMWRVGRGLLDGCLALSGQSDGDLAEAARRDAAFLAVGLELMKPSMGQVPSGQAGGPGRLENPKEFTAEDLGKYAFEVPAEIEGKVSAEVELVLAHAGMSASPIFLYKEDYSQYLPRGHYTASEKLKNYFRAMMWFGRMTFLIKGTTAVGPGETCANCDALISAYDARIQTLGALILADLMNRDPVLMEAWERTYRVTAFFVGFSDDLGPYEYIEAMNQVFGGTPRLQSSSQADQDRLKAKLAEFRSPMIYGGTGGCTIPPPFTPEQADKCLAKTRGFRLMGQRFVPDSFILSRLVAPYPGGFLGGELPFTAYNIPGVGAIRAFPRGLDVMAVLGSQRARRVMDDLGDTHYETYDGAFSEIKGQIDAIDAEEWHKNLYWTWLWSLEAVLQKPGQGYPAFMQTDAWQDRVLKIALASWTELRHDTILYVKQSYTVGMTGMPPAPVALGYVEPCPELYNRLLAMTRMTRLGLQSMDLLNDTQEARLTRLEDVLGRLISMSLAELRGDALTEDDGRYIGRFGEVLGSVVSGINERSRKTTVVADVHTDPNSGEVLEEAVGYVDLLVMVCKSGDGIYLAAGPELSYYEFKQPMEDRLTDEAWREVLQTSPPPHPAW